VDVVTVAAGLGSGLEGCQPLFRTRGTGGGKDDGCGRRSSSESNRLSWRPLVMLRESVAPLGRYGDLLNGFMIPGTDTVKVKGKNMTFVDNDGQRASRYKLPSRDVLPH